MDSDNNTYNLQALDREHTPVIQGTNMLAKKMAEDMAYANAKKYFDSNTTIDFINAATLGLLNRGSISQDARLIKDAYNTAFGDMTYDQLINSATLGNEGIFENPLYNTLIDFAIPLGTYGTNQLLNTNKAKNLIASLVTKNSLLPKNFSPNYLSININNGDSDLIKNIHNKNLAEKLRTAYLTRFGENKVLNLNNNYFRSSKQLPTIMEEFNPYQNYPVGEYTSKEIQDYYSQVMLPLMKRYNISAPKKVKPAIITVPDNINKNIRGWYNPWLDIPFLRAVGIDGKLTNSIKNGLFNSTYLHEAASHGTDELLDNLNLMSKYKFESFLPNDYVFHPKISASKLGEEFRATMNEVRQSLLETRKEFNGLDYFYPQGKDLEKAIDDIGINLLMNKMGITNAYGEDYFNAWNNLKNRANNGNLRDIQNLINFENNIKDAFKYLPAIGTGVIGTTALNNKEKALGGPLNAYAGGGILDIISNFFTDNKQSQIKPKVYISLSGQHFKTAHEAAIDNFNLQKGRGKYAPKNINYIVKAGDSLWNIARTNNTTVNNLMQLNPNLKNNIIFPNQNLVIGKKQGVKAYNIRKQWEADKKLNNNLSVIQSVKHDNNYIVIDKKNSLLNVFDKNNKLIYKTNDISTGASGNDYNTITYVDKSGNIKSGKGNNSTPAGITKITGTGIYHGYPSFTRGRSKGSSYEDIASSLHFGNTSQQRLSNGCVRIGGNTLNQLSKYIDIGTDVYTLPEKKGSKFVAKDGKLSFVANKPYGKDIKGDPKRFWDDYNISINKSYSPLKIVSTVKGNKEYKENERRFIDTLINKKQELMKRFNLDSDTYNHIAELSLGIANQESKMGTGTSLNPKHNYKLKTAIPWLVDIMKSFSGGAVSRGYGQVKLKGDNKKLRDIYNNLGINENNIYSAENGALSILARLAYMYNTEVKGRKFKGANGNIDPYTALIYKYNGRSSALKKGDVNPDNNSYIKNVRKYAAKYNMYSIR